MTAVLPVCGQAPLQSQLFNLRNERIYDCLAENLLPLGFDMAYLATGVGHIVWHGGLEGGIAEKHHQ